MVVFALQCAPNGEEPWRGEQRRGSEDHSEWKTKARGIGQTGKTEQNKEIE